MAFNAPFPQYPSKGELVTYQGSAYRWDGEYWWAYGTSSGYVLTGNSLGNGISIFRDATGNTINFKSFSGNGINITDNGSVIIFSGTGGSGSGGSTTFSGGTITGPTIFTNGLSANTISATTYLNLPSTPATFTGGTISGATRFTGGLSANTISATTYQNLPTDIRVTGGTYSNGTATFTNNTGGTFLVSGFSTSTSFTGGTVTGATNFTGGITANTISATTYQNLPTDIRVTGGTLSGGIATFTNNTGGTFTVSGFSSTFTGGTVTGATNFTGGLSANTFSATTYLNLPTDIRVTGGTYSNGITTFTNNTGGTFNVTGFTNPFTGGTVTGATNFTGGLSANTISATTYVNLPTDVRVTGGTLSGGIVTFTNNTGGTFTISGFSSVFTGGTVTGATNFTGGLSANTFSATTLFGNGSGLTGTLKYYISGSTPSGLINNGDKWFNTETAVELTYITDADGSQWVQTNGGAGVSNAATGGTYSNGTITLLGTGALSSITGLTTPFTGGTITGLTVNGNLIVTGNTSLQGLTASTISATTYQNLPTDVRITGATYSNNNFTFTNNTGGTFSVLFNTLTGLTVNGGLIVTGNTSLQGLTASTISVTGTTFLGNGTFTKAGNASGDILLDNSSTDTPGILFYYANNSNYGIDSWSGSFDVLSGQLIRITNKLNETGGAVKMAIDTSGNLVVGGFVKANAWRAGQVVNDIMLSNTEVTVSTTTIATSTSDTDFVTYSYTPLSSTSYLVIHYHLASFSFEGGTGNDSYFSRIKVDGTEITYSRQSTVNGNRTGVLFPLTGRYTNSNTTAKSIVVACRRDSADDSITIVNSATSMWLRITEIAR